MSGRHLPGSQPVRPLPPPEEDDDGLAVALSGVSGVPVPE